MLSQRLIVKYDVQGAVLQQFSKLKDEAQFTAEYGLDFQAATTDATKEFVGESYQELLKINNSICHLIRKGNITASDLARILEEGFSELILGNDIIASSFFRTLVEDGKAKLAVDSRYPGSGPLITLIRKTTRNILGMRVQPQLFDLITSVDAASEAILNRATFIARAIVAKLEEAGIREVDALELGSGSAIGTAALIEELVKKGIVVNTVTLMDTDGCQGEAASRKINDLKNTLHLDGMQVFVVYGKENGNALKLESIIQALDGRTPNVVFAEGLSDYLPNGLQPDESNRFKLPSKIKFSEIKRAVAADDAIIVDAVFQNGYPSDSIITIVMNWYLNTVTQGALFEICTRAGLQDVTVHELNKAQLVSVGRKQGAQAK